MEWLKRTLFEDPLPIYVLMAAAELVVAGLWYRARTRRLAIALLIPPVLAAAALMTDLLVVTDRERIQIILKDIAADIDRGDFPAVSRYLADDFWGNYVSRGAAVEAARKARETYGITSIRVASADVEIREGIPLVHARTVVTFSQPAVGEGRVLLDWTVHWGRRGGQWKVVNVEQPRVSMGM